jgi:hypothetical protein
LLEVEGATLQEGGVFEAVEEEKKKSVISSPILS